ncbi:dihydrofolate reductase family protein [Amnibacterium flavum]|uniref:Deaminase n=1 Tax=Amnibacterium flavum TaxID=2173173 RepID=A0A2V1HVD9_9MICO|nr:dihydrofolate reductase family protein [Amnibacterium flavum]PVZ94307.1 deaminase [Amnibacterium flavum]
MAIQYYVASSLDGFIAAPDDDIDWLISFGMAEFQDHYDAFIADVGAIVMGSSTYAFIVDQGAESWTYGTTPSWVMTSRDLPGIEGADIRFATGEIGPVLAAAADAAAGRNVWVVGGGLVAAQAAEAGLLDELHVTLMPVVLGAGSPLLPVRDRLGPLNLTGTTAFPSGAVELVYEVAARAAG